jgi:hypothetical protein
MGNLTADQAVQVSDILHELSDAISGYVISNQDTLSPDEKQSLLDYQGKILDQADGLLDDASDLVFADVALQLKQLDSINTGITQRLKVLGDIQNIIEIAADVLTLTESICTFNPGAIAQSAGDILDKLGIKVD